MNINYDIKKISYRYTIIFKTIKNKNIEIGIYKIIRIDFNNYFQSDVSN